MCLFVHFALPASLKVDSKYLLFEKVKQYPVLSDQQMKEDREKYVVTNTWNAGTKDLVLIGNGKSKLILFFMSYLG